MIWVLSDTPNHMVSQNSNPLFNGNDTFDIHSEKVQKIHVNDTDKWPIIYFSSINASPPTYSSDLMGNLLWSAVPVTYFYNNAIY